MTHFLWSFLNFGVFLFFIFICFKATKLIKDSLGILAAIIFVIGLLSFMGHGDSDGKTESQQIKKWKFNSLDSIHSNTAYTNVEIEKNLSFTLNIGVLFQQDSSKKEMIPIEANSLMFGLLTGFEWKPGNISVEQTQMPRIFSYHVYGVVE